MVEYQKFLGNRILLKIYIVLLVRSLLGNSVSLELELLKLKEFNCNEDTLLLQAFQAGSLKLLLASLFHSIEQRLLEL